jgi:Leucine-rich repeat (LRR) protein
LNLINNNITNLRALAHLVELQWLALNFNQITNLKPLTGLKKLKVLMLTGNPDLEDSEVEKIEDLLPDCNIEY